MPNLRILAMLMLSIVGTGHAQQPPPEAHVTPLMTKALFDYKGYPLSSTYPFSPSGLFFRATSE